MRTTRQIQDAISDLRDELDGIISLSEKENRDLNDAETARVTAITDDLIPAETKQLQLVSNVEKELNQRGAKQMHAEIDANMAAAGIIEPKAKSYSFKVPARAKATGELRAFKGENAERDAYVAGSVILAELYGNESAIRFCRDHGLSVRGTLTSNDNSKGGFFVPDEMSRAMIRLREERGVFPQYANRVPMGSDLIRIPRLLSDVTAYWVGETSEITASDLGIGAAELMARKIAAMTKLSSELDEDSVVEVGDMVTQSIAYAMADKIDDAAFNGDGTSTYGGVLGLKNAIHSSATSTAATGNDAATNLDLTDFEAAVGMFPMYPGASPRWFMHSAFYWASAARLMDAAGGNTNVSLGSGPPVTMFLGYPVTFTNVLHSTTSQSQSTIYGYFGDLRLGASYGVRRSARTEVSTERYFENDLIAIKVTERVAINIHERGADIRTRPIIALKTAA
jgi:HK97 family phage major capsid protein